MSVKNSIFNTPYLMCGKDCGFERYSNVYIIGPQGFYLKDNVLVKDILDEAVYWLPTTLSSKWLIDRRFDDRVVNERLNSFDLYAKSIYRYASKNKLIKKLSPEYTYVDISHPFGWYAFGHLHDSLQRLFNLRDLLGKTEKRYKFIVSKHDRVNDFLIHLSVFAGYLVSEDDLVLLGDGIYSVDDIIKPYMSSVYTNFRSDVFEWMYQRYWNHFRPASVPEGAKLYLSRNHVKPGSRGVLNEGDFISKLVDAGFVIVRGSESLDEIYRIFSTAKLIIGPHGSLFANTIFAPEDCHIVEFCPDNRVDTSFLRKTKKSTRYNQIKLPSDEKFNVIIPEDVIFDIIRTIVN